MKKRKIYELCKEARFMLDTYNSELELLYKNRRKTVPLFSNKLKEDIDNLFAEEDYIDLYDTVYKYVRDKLGSINYFKSTISNMNNLLEDSDTSKILEMRNELSNLIDKVNCVISLFDTMLGQSEEGIGLEIKLPDTDNITELKKTY